MAVTKSTCWKQQRHSFLEMCHSLKGQGHMTSNENHLIITRLFAKVSHDYHTTKTSTGATNSVAQEREVSRVCSADDG